MFFDKAANRNCWFGSLADPIIQFFRIKLDNGRFLHRVVGAYDFKEFAPVIKNIPPGHGSVERELDAVFDHSEPAANNLLTKIEAM